MLRLQSVKLPVSLIIGLVVFLWLTQYLRGHSGCLPLPPGPPGLPVIGNLLRSRRGWCSKTWVENTVYICLVLQTLVRALMM